MKIQGNLTKAPEVQRTYQPLNPSAPSQQALRSGSAARRFDSVTINGGNYGSFELELRGRLSREVRTATSSGMVADLREQVRSGAYQTDSGAIARKMLLLGEAV